MQGHRCDGIIGVIEQGNGCVHAHLVNELSGGDLKDLLDALLELVRRQPGHARQVGNGKGLTEVFVHKLDGPGHR